MSASLLKQLQEKLLVGSKYVTKNGTALYKQTLEKNKQYIDKEPTVEKCQELSNQLLYTRLASLPHRYEAFWKEIDALKKKAMNRQDLKIEEVGLAALFSLECYAWFCVGEIIGRGGTLTGYYP
uniref:TSA: Wollemia nobilis Ref_Wollemi_Transcript_15593_839 transcribed RNA sequence n=1 Tax=Wollemia nobilis TaxID=56998 RepID=A0A0C9RIQ6_9CONI